jgi:nitrogen fixation NifU-like protein
LHEQGRSAGIQTNTTGNHKQAFSSRPFTRGPLFQITRLNRLSKATLNDFRLCDGPLGLSPYASHQLMPVDEEELYQEHILDHYEDPFHRGQLPGATHSHEDNNPLCGDVVRVELQLDRQGTIKDAYFNGQGCVISQASASMLLENMLGKSVEDVKKFSAEDMLKLYGARLTPNRQKCCLLSWKVLQSAVHSPINPNDNGTLR